MRLLHLTAGAADMYCGTCLRDNALAAALLKRGHDVVLMPVYTPTHTDDRNVSLERVFFGGVSVYLEQHVPLFRHTPAILDRLWDSSSVLKLASKRQIQIDAAFLGGMTVSMLKGEDGFQKKEVEKLLGWLANEKKFDAINLPFTLLIGLAGPLKRALNVPIACTLQGEDLFLEQLHEPWKSQALELIRSRLGDVDVFLAVSDYYATFMQSYLGIPAAKMQKVPLGINVDGFSAHPIRTSPPYTIGYFARVAPEKGLHVLADAYRRLRSMRGVPPTRLLAGGYLPQEHRGYLTGIERELTAAGLAAEFRYAGAPDRDGKIALLAEMDIMSVPTTYVDPKGLFLLEAMASGVPVVQPRHGAFPEIIERTGGGLLVEPGDPHALAMGLFELLTDPGRRAELAAAGAAGVRRHYAAEHMAADAERILGALAC
jgi:glycosyltransferase involved in cell wall biosynthesis